ncbi:MAG: hypothetical protein NC217_08885 [Muribaculaceae bacterium]|nr:hypothetical protein [Muribaculaceae bacterium]
MKFYNSRLFTGVALVLIIAVICATFTLRTVWWSYIDIFCFFMAAFCQLMALTVCAKLPRPGATLSLIALAFCIAGVVALIGEAIAWGCLA